jgi:flagellar biosynthetic protein FliP
VNVPTAAAPSLADFASAGLQTAAGQGSTAVKLFLVLTALSFGTAIVLSVTSFTRIIIVFSFLRQAMGTPQLPPNQVLVGLSLFLTLFIMAPTVRKIHEQALTPLMDDKISVGEALGRAQAPLSEWMLKQTRDDDLRLFFEVSGTPRPVRGEVVPFTVLVPSFMISELSTAFRMGLFLFIPMLLIDLLVSIIMMSLGMMMVPPTLVAMPLKLGVFLLAGGWHLVVSSIIRSF